MPAQAPVQVDTDRALDRTSNAALIDKYDAIAYAAQSNASSHPDHLAAIATLFGLDPAPPATCRVLELGCSDGANLLPMAASLPNAHFVGCDLSPRALAAARSAVAELGLGNVTLFEGDLRALPAAPGEFDYIVAHGVYSWVPAPVREALFALAERRLKQDGVMFVSYNVYPGCHVRQAVWRTLHYHIDRIEGAWPRIKAARTLAAAIAEPGPTQFPADALLRNEFRTVAQAPDSALYHDDLAEPNDPVYFHEFAAHAARYGLQYLAEAELPMNAAQVSPAMQRLLAGCDRLEREQLHDFAQLRRFRQSLLCRAESATGFALAPERLRSLRIGASRSLQRTAAEGRPLVDPVAPNAPAGDDAGTLLRAFDVLLAIAPQTIPFADLAARLASPLRAASRPLEAILADACLHGSLWPALDPPALTAVAGERPKASAFARWQSKRGVAVTNLQHQTMQLQDVSALQLLTLLDGTRTRAELVVEMAKVLPGWERAVIGQRIDEYLLHFGKLALLVA